jgi:hypothetical protein
MPQKNMRRFIGDARGILEFSVEIGNQTKCAGRLVQELVVNEELCLTGSVSYFGSARGSQF